MQLVGGEPDSSRSPNDHHLDDRAVHNHHDDSATATTIDGSTAPDNDQGGIPPDDHDSTGCTHASDHGYVSAEYTLERVALRRPAGREDAATFRTGRTSWLGHRTDGQAARKPGRIARWYVAPVVPERVQSFAGR